MPKTKVVFECAQMRFTPDLLSFSLPDKIVSDDASLRSKQQHHRDSHLGRGISEHPVVPKHNTPGMVFMVNITGSGRELMLDCEIRSEQKTFIVCTLIIIYLMSMFGNLLVILVIQMNQHLQTVMYMCISTLAVIDMANSSTIIPKMLADIQQSNVVMPYAACVLQMYLILNLQQMESLLLSFMAFDRYIAVVYPLRYNSVLTKRIVQIVISCLPFLPFVIHSPFVIFASELNFCHTNTLHFCMCDYYTMVNTACNDDPKYLNLMSVMVILLGVFPLEVILFSYVRIALTALRLSSIQRNSKVFSTCVTHLLVMCFFYFPPFVCLMLPGSGIRVTTDVYNVMVIAGNVIPPMLNPVIYTLRNKDIKSRIYMLKDSDVEFPRLVVTAILDSMKMSNAISNASITISEFILQCAIESNHNNVLICVLTFIYFMSMFGNLLVIVVIILNPQLHAPMYLYISTLAVIDLANCSILVPKMVSVLLGSPVVPYAACVLQMILVPHVEEMESFLLVFMAFDRYVAIVYPLQYPSAITNKKVGIGVLVSNIFGIVMKLHLLIFVSELSFCRTNILPFCFCDYATMVHMSCNEEPKHLTSLSAIVAIFAVFPLIFIFISYSRIAIEALKISSAGGKVIQILETAGGIPKVIQAVMQKPKRCCRCDTMSCKISKISHKSKPGSSLVRPEEFHSSLASSLTVACRLQSKQAQNGETGF
ncbi:O1496 protein, partial [Polypterus senegalus]